VVYIVLILSGYVSGIPGRLPIMRSLGWGGMFERL